ncbi:MAG: peptidylprolyl isomerase [Acidobacteria bacterium]|nr:peptidylprolyl isomerase [Acidobacteriota bacterium]
MIRFRYSSLYLVVVVFLLGIAGCGSAPPPEKAAEAAPPPVAEEPVKEPAPVETAKLEPPAPAPKVEPKPAPKVEPKPAPPKAPAMPVVVMETSKGTIKIELNPERAPVTVKNFLEYVDAKFYDGTIFHRVMPNFMIQGGGFAPDMSEKPNRAPIKIESDNGLANLRGTIAMARTSNPNSATSQFFINHKTNGALDKSFPRGDGFGYAVFGKVIEGLDVLDAIAVVPTATNKGHGNVPVEPVIIKSVRRAG